MMRMNRGLARGWTMGRWCETLNGVPHGPVKDHVSVVVRHEHTCTNHLSYMGVASQVLRCGQLSRGFGMICGLG
jgi:hypothetical protein